MKTTTYPKTLSMTICQSRHYYVTIKVEVADEAEAESLSDKGDEDMENFIAKHGGIWVFESSDIEVTDVSDEKS